MTKLEVYKDLMSRITIGSILYLNECSSGYTVEGIFPCKWQKCDNPDDPCRFCVGRLKLIGENEADCYSCDDDFKFDRVEMPEELITEGEFKV